MRGPRHVCSQTSHALRAALGRRYARLTKWKAGEVNPIRPAVGTKQRTACLPVPSHGQIISPLLIGVHPPSRGEPVDRRLRPKGRIPGTADPPCTPVKLEPPSKGGPGDTRRGPEYRGVVYHRGKGLRNA